MSRASASPLRPRLPRPNDFSSVAPVMTGPCQGALRLTPAQHWGLDGFSSVAPSSLSSPRSVPALPLKNCAYPCLEKALGKQVSVPEDLS